MLLWSSGRCSGRCRLRSDCGLLLKQKRLKPRFEPIKNRAHRLKQFILLCLHGSEFLGRRIQRVLPRFKLLQFRPVFLQIGTCFFSTIVQNTPRRRTLLFIRFVTDAPPSNVGFPFVRIGRHAFQSIQSCVIVPPGGIAIMICLLAPGQSRINALICRWTLGL